MPWLFWKGSLSTYRRCLHVHITYMAWALSRKDEVSPVTGDFVLIWPHAEIPEGPGNIYQRYQTIDLILVIFDTLFIITFNDMKMKLVNDKYNNNIKRVEIEKLKSVDEIEFGKEYSGAN